MMPAPSPLDPEALRHCCLCPRRCGVDRFAGPSGYCRTGAGYAVSAVTVHRGEEPVISGERGICNVFFAHCNLRCGFCQNYQISRPQAHTGEECWTLDTVVAAIVRILDTGIDRLGFVSASHLVPQMAAIITAVRRQGFRPVVVYNSNGYDRVETLRHLDDLVDVYLPDCKYMDPVLSARWSGAGDYPEVAARALAEMYRQRGSVLHLDDQGLVTRGLIVRHLVLPGAVTNTRQVLRFLAESLSPRLTLSLMAQYNPTPLVAAESPLNRRLLPAEYAEAVAEMERLGFVNGWVQEFASAERYNPDFSAPVPFAEEAGNSRTS